MSLVIFGKRKCTADTKAEVDGVLLKLAGCSNKLTIAKNTIKEAEDKVKADEAAAAETVSPAQAANAMRMSNSNPNSAKNAAVIRVMKMAREKARAKVRAREEARAGAAREKAWAEAARVEAAKVEVRAKMV